jgi:poly-beta-1,6-N-acetyl-D-glucosamine N-deacetylase
MFKCFSFALLLWASYCAQAATVLIYHHVSNTMPASTSISPERFAAHMDYLAKNNFRVVTLAELEEKIRDGEPLPDKTVAITFDDSYADVYASAYPVLKKYGWPFTFFVNTDSVGSGKLFVTWDQLREMSKHGVTIANHTRTHLHMVRANKDENERQWLQRIEDEIDGAQKKIEQEIGTAPKVFAYPFGEYNAELKKLLKKKGYIAFTQQAGVIDQDTDTQTLPRFPFGGSYTELKDFVEKVNALPMPVKSVGYYANDSKQLEDMQLKAGENPYLVLQLRDPALLLKVRCFSSAEGAISARVVDGKLWVKGSKPLTSGRTKFTCTAPSGERGRYLWFNQLWLASDKAGNWTYQD